MGKLFFLVALFASFNAACQDTSQNPWAIIEWIHQTVERIDTTKTYQVVVKEHRFENSGKSKDTIAYYLDTVKRQIVRIETKQHSPLLNVSYYFDDNQLIMVFENIKYNRPLLEKMKNVEITNLNQLPVTYYFYFYHLGKIYWSSGENSSGYRTSEQAVYLEKSKEYLKQGASLL